MCLLALVAYLGVRIPAMSAQAEKVIQEKAASSEEYYNAQAKAVRLTNELKEVNTRAFVERIARRDQGYVWYGEVIYTISNIEALMEEKPFDHIYGEENAAETENTDEESEETGVSEEQPAA